MMIKKPIKDLTQEERLCLLSYDEIYKNFIFKNEIYESSMIGNTFYISTVHKRFKKKKNLLMLVCCCGVSVQTMIDILVSYNAIDKNKIIEFEIRDQEVL